MILIKYSIFTHDQCQGRNEASLANRGLTETCLRQIFLGISKNDRPQTSSPRSFRDTGLGLHVHTTTISFLTTDKAPLFIRVIFFQHCNETQPSPPRRHRGRRRSTCCASVRSELGRCFLRAWVAHAPVVSEAAGLSSNFFLGIGRAMTVRLIDR